MNQNSTPLYLGDKLIPACEIYIVYQNTEVLMFKRSSSSKDFPNFLIGPGGHIDQNEDALSAVIRETKEETGIILEPTQIKLKVLAFHHHLDRKEVWIEYIFRAAITDKPDTNKNIEGDSVWMDIDDLLKNELVFPPSKHYLPHIFAKDSGIKYSSCNWENFRLLEVACENIQLSN